MIEASIAPHVTNVPSPSRGASNPIGARAVGQDLIVEVGIFESGETTDTEHSDNGDGDDRYD
jgi:hypothetical protein